LHAADTDAHWLLDLTGDAALVDFWLERVAFG
jgi:hypothetical protein